MQIELNAPDNAMGYIPDESCINWCVPQRVVHENNTMIYGVFFIGASILFTFIAEYLISVGKHETASELIYWSRVLQILFIFLFFYSFSWHLI